MNGRAIKTTTILKYLQKRIVALCHMQDNKIILKWRKRNLKNGKFFKSNYRKLYQGLTWCSLSKGMCLVTTSWSCPLLPEGSRPMRKMPFWVTTRSLLALFRPLNFLSYLMTVWANSTLSRLPTKVLIAGLSSRPM